MMKSLLLTQCDRQLLTVSHPLTLEQKAAKALCTSSLTDRRILRSGSRDLICQVITER